MSWFKREMKAFWFSCRHPFGIDDIKTPDNTAPVPAEQVAIRNLLMLSKERVDIGRKLTKGEVKPIEKLSPITIQLAERSIDIIESYIRKFPDEEEEDST